MMNSENTPKEIVQSLIDLVNMVKWLIRGRGRRGESSELLRAGAGESSASATDTNNTSFATRPTRKRTIEEIWRSKASSKKP